MKIKKYPESLPDLEILERRTEFGFSYFITLPEKWPEYRSGASYLEISLEGDLPDTPRRYEVDLEHEGFHFALSEMEKDQLYIFCLNEKGLRELFP